VPQSLLCDFVNEGLNKNLKLAIHLGSHTNIAGGLDAPPPPVGQPWFTRSTQIDFTSHDSPIYATQLLQ